MQGGGGDTGSTLALGKTAYLKGGKMRGGTLA